jgi:hypothetical protein
VYDDGRGDNAAAAAASCHTTGFFCSPTLLSHAKGAGPGRKRQARYSFIYVKHTILTLYLTDPSEIISGIYYSNKDYLPEDQVEFCSHVRTLSDLSIVDPEITQPQKVQQIEDQISKRARLLQASKA